MALEFNKSDLTQMHKTIGQMLQDLTDMVGQVEDEEQGKLSGHLEDAIGFLSDAQHEIGLASHLVDE